MVRILKTVSQIHVCEAMIFLRYWCSKSIWQNSLLNSCNSGVLMKALSIGSWVLAASICYNSSIDSDIRHLWVLDALSICVYSSIDSDIRHFWVFDSQSICVYSSIDSDIRHFWVLDALSICVYSSIDSDIRHCEILVWVSICDNSSTDSHIWSLFVSSLLHRLTWLHKLTSFHKVTPELG